MKHQPHAGVVRLDALIGALREGELSSEGSAELRQLLATQPGALRRLTEHMFLVATLEAELVSCDPDNYLTPSARKALRITWWKWAAAIAGLAAVLALLAVLWPTTRVLERPVAKTHPAALRPALFDSGVAILTKVVDARWAGHGQPNIASPTPDRSRFLLLGRKLKHILTIQNLHPLDRFNRGGNSYGVGCIAF